MTGRRAELAQRLAAVQEQIRGACASAGRDPGSVTLVAVSKTWPASDIAILHDLGVSDFGENRAEDLLAKSTELAGRPLRWHFLGQIQSKKAVLIGHTAHVVHSVDREKIIAGLGAGAQQADREVEAFIQVSLAGMAPATEASGRGGADPAEVPALARAIEEQPGLRLAGVMTLPPRAVDPGAAFAALAMISAQLRASQPRASAVSAGMSHDFADAIAAGATHVRIGSAVFGERRPVR